VRMRTNSPCLRVRCSRVTERIGRVCVNAISAYVQVVEFRYFGGKLR